VTIDVKRSREAEQPRDPRRGLVFLEAKGEQKSELAVDASEMAGADLDIARSVVAALESKRTGT